MKSASQFLNRQKPPHEKQQAESNDTLKTQDITAG